jgi:hypothetical protein
VKLRLVLLLVAAVALLAPVTAHAFHHGALPATSCHADAAESPSNDNGQAKEKLSEHNPNGIPLAPVGTEGQDNLAAAPAHAACANAPDD